MLISPFQATVKRQYKKLESKDIDLPISPIIWSDHKLLELQVVLVDHSSEGGQEAARNRGQVLYLTTGVPPEQQGKRGPRF